MTSISPQNGSDVAGRGQALLDQVEQLLGKAADKLGLEGLVSELESLLSKPSALDRFVPAAERPSAQTAPPAGDPAQASYRVKAGDTLTEIAQRHDIGVEALARSNGIADPDRIQAGQTLRVPDGPPAAAAQTSYRVQAGDTLGEIAQRFDIGVAALARANGISNPDRITPGQTLQIGGGGGGTTQVGDPTTNGQQAPTQAGGTHRLGGLSEVYESGNRGPGTVSSGTNDPGGVSYGVYQLSSNAGTLGSFLRNEGAAWSGDLTAAPGSAAFSDQWRALATREPDAFRAAQHGFIERTHYQPAVAAVSDRTGLDLNSRHDAVRDATWSVSVQHGGAATILNRAVAATDAQLQRTDAGYDRALINNIYDQRTSYVQGVAANPNLSAGERQQLIDITQNRYPAERRDALAMLDAQPAAAAPAAQPGPPAQAPATGTIDGNVVARDNGVAVKSDSVRLTQLDVSMQPVIAATAQAARELGLPQPVITSGNDSRHSTNSLHYENRALDFRGNNISVAQGERFEARVRELVGAGYDIDFETFANSSNNHLHVEYDPR